MATLSVPGKIFLLGEYAILAGLPAIVAAVGPRFELRLSHHKKLSFHPQSPGGRLLTQAGLPSDLPFEFYDPFEGAGGFGASTAQFALSYRALARERGWSEDWLDVWKCYRDLCRDPSGESIPPSGADLLAQWVGGIICCQIEDSERADLRHFNGSSLWQNLMVFSASHQSGRKTATHHHLGSLHSKEFSHVAERLRMPLDAGLRAARANDAVSFGQAMTLYAEELRSAGLEIEPTLADRTELSKISGVLGVKGTGASQSDAIIVLVDPSEPGCKDRVIQAALARDLRLVSSGLTVEPGISGETQ
ncbi:MAG: hypothetical protein P4M08_11265 [Oligoflexia bacterium]|nr:hypothetical protein [Oligoflexia bacterium]